MKTVFPPLLARLRARPDAADARKTIDVRAVIEGSLRDAGLLRANHPTAVATNDDAIDDSIIEGEFRVVPVRAKTATAPTHRKPAPSEGGSFSAGHFALGSDARDYKLFVPAGFAGESLPLIVMLHGCTQDPDDFARGTRMNQLAQENGALVLYPAQAPRSNGARCWNWFQPGDQRRDAGEPALLSAMTRHIVAGHVVDPRRVHVAGLSAGGAMAAILGQEYPDLFASIGVHSGLPPGAAHGVASAFASMRSAPVRDHHAPGTPVIVFHGDQDRTVDPRNGENVLGTARPDSAEARTRESAESGRPYTRTVIRDSEGHVRAEYWLVHGAGHAWSGGSPEGSYADALGPDASREMMRFFREHPRR